MNTIIRLSTASRGFNIQLCRSFVNVGDKVPINYIKDKQHPIIKEDKEYPEWLSELSGRLPGKPQLLRKVREQGVESLTLDEAKRLKRALTLEKIKNANMLASTKM